MLKVFISRREILRAHIEYQKDPLVLCLHYNPDLASIEDVRRIATRMGTSIANIPALLPMGNIFAKPAIAISALRLAAGSK